jgi:hypothetical protein
MKKIDLGPTITLIANLGVIIGIGFLAYELRQNTTQLSLTLEWQVNQRQVDLNRDFLSSDGRDIFEKMIIRPNDLTFAEFQAATGLIFNFLNLWEDRFFLYKNGFITEQEWKDYIDDDISNTLGSPFAKALWATSKGYFEQEMIDYVDEQLATVASDGTYQWYLDTLDRVSTITVAE